MTLSVFDEGGYRVVILLVMCSKPCPCHQVFFLVLTMRSNVSIRCFESHSPCSVLLNNLQILCTSRAREARINQFVLADLQDSCPTQGLAFPTLTRYRRYRMNPPLQVYSRMARLGQSSLWPQLHEPIRSSGRGRILTTVSPSIYHPRFRNYVHLLPCL